MGFAQNTKGNNRLIKGGLIMNIIHKGIAKFFWNACDRIDNMPCRNIDELARKADEVTKLRKE